jgi:uncharacterized protein YecE (DUF72 family)
MGEVRIGTSGWHYPNGAGTWNGLFYPLTTERRRGFDELAYYAEHFDTVEVNVTFYRQPVAATTASWAARTPPGFDFAVKLHQGFTHAVTVRGEERTPPPLPTLTTAAVDEFRRGIAPLADAGKLAALLVQFPPSYRRTSETTGYLATLLSRLRDYPLAVELRDRSWSDAEGDTASLLSSAGAAFVQIDEPKFRFSIRQSLQPNDDRLFYVRLHGRNAAQWWRHDSPDDRYNYLYSTAELAPIIESTRAARPSVRKAYLFFNNHFAAKAVVNATVVKDQLGQTVTGEYLDALVRRYPELGPLVPSRPTAPPGMLF